MKLKINKDYVPIKAHFFFFFAALGPILSQLNVFGRQLGVSPGVMGLVTAVLPLLWAVAKPLFGYIVDYWPSHRKFVFMCLITLMSSSYCCLWFLPMPEFLEPSPVVEYVYQLNDTVYLRTVDEPTLEKYTCHWNCSPDKKIDIYLTNSTYINSIFVDQAVTNTSCSLYYMDLDSVREGEVVCIPRIGCNLLCFEDDDLNLELMKNVNRTKRAVESSLKNDVQNNDNKIVSDLNKVEKSSVKGDVEIKGESRGSFYMTSTFWGFVVLMCVGTVAFNVANCIGDAVCFDVLGPNGAKYGTQRAWGTAGYGLTALAGGWLVDAVSGTGVKDFTPAFVLVLVFTAVDLYSCRALTLPPMSSPDDSGKALRSVLKIPRVLVFIAFAIVAGIFDSFIIYYMFWFLEELADSTGHTDRIKFIEGVVVAAQRFLEELADSTGHTDRIKFIEGVVVAAQSFIGEIVFFHFSGRIIKRWGYGTTLTFSLFCYGVRMALISLITNPWHLVFIEGIMQGPTYALCYSSIVGYAAHVAPTGYSATVQGIVAGMDDGVGFAIGSLLGGQLYAWLGGRGSFRLFAGVAVLGAALHALLFVTVSKRSEEKPQETAVQEEDQKMLPNAQNNEIYRDTVQPINDGNR